MKKIFVFGCIVILCFLLCCCSSKGEEDVSYRPLYDENGNYSEENFLYNAAIEKSGAHLIVDGKTDYCILYRETTDQTVLTAINDLREYFNVVCGGIEVKVDDGKAIEKAIKIGEYMPLPTSTLKKAGAYIVDVAENNIYIYAETPYGITNGIYGFMEDYLGCVFFDRDTTYIPPANTMILEKGTDVQEPAFTSRDVGDNEANNSTAFRQRLRIRLDESYSSNGCHRSLNRISKDILDAHPEYYAEIDGKRRTDTYNFQSPQLCFSNDEVIDLLEQSVVNEEKNKTSDQVVWWDISQQDSMNYCTCEKCAALTEAAGGNAAAPIFRCVNIIAKRHPELKISTLAYHYGSTPPVNIEFEPNVMIKWCIMSTLGANDYSAPISEGRSTIAYQQCMEILGWSELVDTIYVWDYITDFFHYQLPFPCWNAMEGNIRLLRDCGVDGVFTLSAYNGRGFCDRLKVNLAAHLLWNPDIDAKKFINKYLTLYLGKDAAPYILEMYSIMQETVVPPLWVYDFPFMHKEDFLSEEKTNEYFRLWNEAYEKAAGNETYRKRLRYEKIAILYAQMKLMYGTPEEKTARKAEFVAICDEFSIDLLNEVGSEFVSDYK